MELKNMLLPTLVISTADVVRLERELEALDNYLYQANLRGGNEAAKMPKTTRFMDDFATANKLNLLDDAARKQSLKFLELIRAKAPVVHMSFAVEPSSAFRQKMIIWWRGNVHPHVLMDVGLQPTIAIGTVVRTPNKQYDFSLRNHFEKNRDVLIKLLQTGKPA